MRTFIATMTFTLALTAIGTAEAQTTQTSYVEPRAVAYAVEPAPQQDPNATTTVVDGGLMGAGVTLTVIGAVSLAASLVNGVIAFIVAIASSVSGGNDAEAWGIASLACLGGGIGLLIAGPVMIGASVQRRPVVGASEPPRLALLPSVAPDRLGLSLLGSF
jgi:hypothetical protein